MCDTEYHARVLYLTYATEYRPDPRTIVPRASERPRSPKSSSPIGISRLLNQLCKNGRELWQFLPLGPALRADCPRARCSLCHPSIEMMRSALRAGSDPIIHPAIKSRCKPIMWIHRTARRIRPGGLKVDLGLLLIHHIHHRKPPAEKPVSASKRLSQSCARDSKVSCLR